MIDPSPYRSVAVASTFSPRFEQVLAEAKRIRDRFDSELCLVYVGEKSEETSAKFAAALERISLPKNSPIHYEQGDPATAILRAIERHDIDLIVAQLDALKAAGIARSVNLKLFFEGEDRLEVGLAQHTFDRPVRHLVRRF